jgi:ubiquinone/menaquinone biosynthesis C-methylase UbiE
VTNDDDADEYYFDGTCMIPGQSWNARMEIEHWNRYMTFCCLAESKRVLDVACGDGYGTDLLSSVADEAIGVDISVKNVRHANSKYASARANLKYIAADACDLPLENDSIDVIYSFETIEHLRDIPAFLTNLSRVMSHQGLAILSTPRPNINPATNEPFNPHHVHELSAADFQACLKEHFRTVVLAGQRRTFPYEIHRVFDTDKDAYAVGVAANHQEAVDEVIRRLPNTGLTSVRERLFQRHLNEKRNFPEPLRVLFVPLTNTNCENPADRRRILLPANQLRREGVEVAIVNKADTLNIRSDIIYSQNRDYAFWLRNMDKLKANGARLVFSFSDALGLTSQSKTHDFKAFLGQEAFAASSLGHGALKPFLETCSSYVLAGSDVQRKIISDLAPNTSVGVLNDVIDTDTYTLGLANESRSAQATEFTLIWEGFCDNVPYLLVCADAIKRLSRRIPLRVIVATSPKRTNHFFATTDNRELAARMFGDILEFHVWDRQTIAQLMARSHVGLAPLFTDCAFARAKPPNKAIIYNYMKLPVIASPIFAYKCYIQDNLNGFIANSEPDWDRYIEYLWANPRERAKMAEFGHTKAVESFSVDVISRQMLRIFLLLRKTRSLQIGQRNPAITV